MSGVGLQWNHPRKDKQAQASPTNEEKSGAANWTEATKQQPGRGRGDDKPQIETEHTSYKTSIMSEESKTSDSDYVHMSDRPKAFAQPNNFLDDPNLSQEDRDLRLAIALQQQENAAVYDAHKKKHDAALAANANRTGRSGVHTKLAQVRKKDHGMLSVPDAYTTENAYKKGDHSTVGTTQYIQPNPNATPQEQVDLAMALELQKVEQTGAGTARMMDKIMTEEVEDSKADEMRTARSGKAAFHPTRGKK